MEIPKVPPADFAALPTLAPGARDPGSPPAAPVPAADRALIRVLDLPSALQILLTEVRDALALPPQAFSLPDPAPAAREVVQEFLRSVPPDLPDARWIATVEKVLPALVSALDRAVAAVSAWRDVPSPVVEAVRESRALVIAALVDGGPPIPLMLRPEWAGLAPALSAYGRRRRRLRRQLEEPGRVPLSERDDADDPLDLLP